MPDVAVAPFVYAAQSSVPIACLVCGTENPSTLTRDRYGFRVGVSRCACGFGYLNPQMSAGGYRAFYDGFYRELVQGWYRRHGLPTDDVVDPQAQSRGRLIGGLAARMSPMRPIALCDVGGSTGVIAEGIGKMWPVTTVTIVDPNPYELGQAAARGYTTICALAEDAPALPPQDAVICAQTLDHARDPLAVLRWMRGMLAPGGWLYVDVVDAAKWAVKTDRWPAFDWKLDHPCYWSAPTLKAALTATGWRPRLAVTRGMGSHHVGVFCEWAA